MLKPHLQTTNYKLETNVGFTLIEALVAVAIIVALSTVVILSINPSQYLAKGRDSQRKGNLLTILNAVGQRIVDNKGVFETGCAAGVIPTTATKMAVGGENYDIGPCLVSAYLPNMPFDTKASGAHWTSTTDYDTGYTIIKNATTGRVTVAAPSAELETISYTR